MSAVVVVGAGISGLALAHNLSQRGTELQVLELAARVGGTIRSVEEHGVLTEDGPNSLLDRDGGIRELLGALGLADQIVPAALAARRRFVAHRGRLWPVSPPGVLFSGLLSLRGRLRLLLEPFSRRGGSPDESLASFARRHLGREATEVLVDAFQAGVFAGDPERLEIRAAFPGLVELERTHRSLLIGALRSPSSRGSSGGTTFTLRGGAETLVRALAQRLGASVRTGVGLRSLARVNNGWQLLLTSGERIDADQVALAVPSHAAAAVLEKLDGPLASQLAQIPYASIAVVHLTFSPRVLRTPQGFGFLVPGQEGRRLLGTIHASTVFPHRAPGGEVLLTCLLGGVRAPEVTALSDGALAALAREELVAVTGLTAEPSYVRVVRWPRAIPQYDVGHSARLEQIDVALKRWPGLHLTGNAYRGLGVADCIRNAVLLAESMGIPRSQPP